MKLIVACTALALLLLAGCAAPPEAPPSDGGEATSPVAVTLEGVLRTQLSACGSEFCFGVDVLKVTEGPKELADEKNLNIRTDKELILSGGKILRISGNFMDSYIGTAATGIMYVESDGSLSAPEIVQPEAQPAEVPIEVSFIGYPLGNWEQCGTKWCNRLQTWAYSGSNGEPPAEFLVESDDKPSITDAYAVLGTLAGGKVSAITVEIALVDGAE